MRKLVLFLAVLVAGVGFTKNIAFEAYMPDLGSIGDAVPQGPNVAFGEDRAVARRGLRDHVPETQGGRRQAPARLLHRHGGSGPRSGRGRLLEPVRPLPQPLLTFPSSQT